MFGLVRNSKRGLHDWWNPRLDHPHMRGCIGWWPMFEGGGLTAFDLSGHGRDGALTNMALDDWVVGEFGPALRMSAGSENISIGTGVIDTTTPYTFMLRVQRNSDSGNHVLFFTDNNAFRFAILTSDVVELRTASTNNRSISLITIASGVTHIAATSSGGASSASIKFWLNGVLDVERTSNTTDSASALTISDGTNTMNGDICDARIFDYEMPGHLIHDICYDPWAAMRRPDLVAKAPAAAAGTILPEMMQHNHFGGGVL